MSVTTDLLTCLLIRALAKTEAKNAILSCHSSLGATEDPPCGNLLRPRGYDLPAPTEAGYAKAGGQEPQGFPRPTRVASLAGLGLGGQAGEEGWTI